MRLLAVLSIWMAAAAAFAQAGYPEQVIRRAGIKAGD